MPQVRYPKAWYTLLALVSAALVVALAPFWLSNPVPPTLGPVQRSLLAELQAAFAAAGAIPDQVSCRGAKGSTLVGCSARVRDSANFTSTVSSRGWVPSSTRGNAITMFRRGELELVVEYEAKSVSATVVERPQ